MLLDGLEFGLAGGNADADEFNLARLASSHLQGNGGNNSGPGSQEESVSERPITAVVDFPNENGVGNPLLHGESERWVVPLGVEGFRQLVARLILDLDHTKEVTPNPTGHEVACHEPILCRHESVAVNLFNASQSSIDCHRRRRKVLNSLTEFVLRQFSPLTVPDNKHSSAAATIRINGGPMEWSRRHFRRDDESRRHFARQRRVVGIALDAEPIRWFVHQHLAWLGECFDLDTRIVHDEFDVGSPVDPTEPHFDSGSRFSARGEAVTHWPRRELRPRIERGECQQQEGSRGPLSRRAHVPHRVFSDRVSQINP